MSIRFVSIKCPECRAILNVEDWRHQVFCSYCGSKIMIVNDNEYIYRTIDEAELKKTETELLIRLKELELEENKRIADEKKTKSKIKLFVVLAVIGVAILLIGGIAGLASADPVFALNIIAMIGLFSILAITFIWVSSSKK